MTRDSLASRRDAAGLIPRLLGSQAFVIGLALATTAVMLAAQWRFGQTGPMFVLGAAIALSVFGVISFVHIQIPVIVWLTTMLGFRLIFFVQTPGLPDMTLDRVAMLWVIAIYLLKMVVEKRKLKGPFLLDMLLVLHGSYLLFSVILRNPDGMNNWTKAYLMTYTAYFLGKNLMTERKWLVATFWVMLFTNIYHSFTAIAEHYGWVSLIWPRWILDRGYGWFVEGRARGIFMQPGVLGMCMGMTLGTQLYLLRHTRRLVLRLFVLATIPMAVLGIFFTYTRGAWLVMIIVVFVMAAISIRRYLPVVLVIGISAGLLLASGTVRLQEDKFFQERVGTEHTVTGRVNTLATAYRVWRANPLFGVGFFKYNEVKQDFRETIRVPFFGVIKRTADDEASLHDIYIGVMAEEGLVGASMQAAIYGLILLMYWRIWRSRTVDPHFRAEILPIIVAVSAGYFIGGATFDFRYFNTLMGIFYFMAGIAAGHYEDALKGRGPSLRIRPGLTVLPSTVQR